MINGLEGVFEYVLDSHVCRPGPTQGELRVKGVLALCRGEGAVACWLSQLHGMMLCFPTSCKNPHPFTMHDPST